MRPIRIEMQAFGPYLRQQTLDFRELGDRRVFLIHGPTGGGKTSLFDAMAYALYGKASGGRPVEEMRSKHAPPELSTEVTFDFAIGSDHYRARRRIDFRAKTRGANKGQVEQESLAEFMRLEEDGAGGYRETEALASQDTKVTAAVTERIGLGVEQFLQVIILPQGKFREFLAAKSQTREQILEALFKTTQHKRLQDKLDEESRTLGARLKERQAELRGKAGVSGDAVVDPAVFDAQAAELQARVTAEEARVLPLKEELKQVDAELAGGARLAQRFRDLDTATGILARLDQRRGEMEARERELAAARRAREAEPAELLQRDHELQLRAHRAALPGLEEQARRAAAALETARLARQAAEQSAPLREKHQARLGGLEAVARKLREREQLTATLRADETELKKLEAERAQLETGLREAETTRLPAARAQEAQLRLQAQSAELLAQSLRDLEALRAEAAQLTQQRKESEDVLAQLEKGERLTAEQDTLAQAARRAHEDLDERLAGDQAALLAHRLTDGEPCPVCGAEEHPRPATSSSGSAAVDREQVKRAKLEAEAQAKKLEAYRARVIELRAKREALRLALAGTEARLKARGYVDAAALERRISETRTQAAQAEKARADVDAASRQVRELEKFVTEGQARRDAGQAALRAASARVDEARGKLAALEADLRDEPLRDLPELEAERARLTTETLRITQALEQARKAQDAATQAEAGTRAAVESKRRELDAAETRGTQLTETFVQARTNQGFASDAEYLAAKRSSAVQGEIERELAAYGTERTRAETQRDDAQASTAGQARPQLDGVDARKQELEHAISALNHELGAARAKLDELRRLQRELTAGLTAVRALEAEYAEVRELALVANGHGGNAYNMSFQRYVQSIYFEEVLQAASYRLEKMSQGRYGLKRSEELGRGNVSGGLDLVVEDRWQGTERPASTLSGGEGFMASLSLALALSQIVQEENGAIRMDAIFIDEGFGTLDEEALGRAIETLVELQDSGRMVGLISHVPELRQVIPARIEVTPQPSGSEVRVHV